jgi:magnesium-transporting ATPase (P-type)
MTAISHGDKIRIFVKGAPEFVLESCSHYMTGESNSDELTHGKKNMIVGDVIKNNFAPKALRTIMVAYKDMSLHDFENLKQNHNNFESV